MAVTNVSDADFIKVLKENEKVIVKYYASWCGSCRLFAPKYKRISEEDTYSDIHFIEVDAEENPEARKMSGVDNLPYFAIFKNGDLTSGGPAAKEEFVRDLLSKL